MPGRGRLTKTPSPQVADPRSRRVSRTTDTSVPGALLQEGPAAHPLLMLFHLLLSQTAEGNEGAKRLGRGVEAVVHDGASGEFQKGSCCG